jgi:DNA-binding response OmpR family regulator
VIATTGQPEVAFDRFSEPVQDGPTNRASCVVGLAPRESSLASPVIDTGRRAVLFCAGANAGLRAVGALLDEEGFVAVEVDSIEAALLEISFVTPDIVLVDWERGTGAIARLRAQRPTAIIVACGMPGDAAGIEALDAGADDYVDARCAARAVCARVCAHHRRSTRPPPAAVPDQADGADGRFGILPGGVVLVDGAAIQLTRIEERLFAELVRLFPGDAARADLLTAGWPGVRVTEHTFHVRLSGLRAKLAEVGTDVLFTARRGYQLVLPAASAPETLRSMARVP